jgi:hypothetical protein
MRADGAGWAGFRRLGRREAVIQRTELLSGYFIV